MKKCPKCMKNTESKFCPDCGYDMSTVDLLICPNCGSESSSCFCPNCGTKMIYEVEPCEKIDSSDPTQADTGLKDIALVEEKHQDVHDAGPELKSVEKKDNTGPSQSSDRIRTMLTKIPVLIGIAAVLVVLILVGVFGSHNSSTRSSSNDSTGSYTADNEDSSSNDYTSDYSESSSSYSDTDDGINLIQGTWEMVGVVNDGESTNLSGLSAGSLVIDGSRWKMTISAYETTENSGTLYFDMKSTTDSGEPFYVYTMKSDGMSGSVKMAYSSEDDFIAVSTNSTLDSDNCMMFGR